MVHYIKYNVPADYTHINNSNIFIDLRVTKTISGYLVELVGEALVAELACISDWNAIIEDAKELAKYHFNEVAY